MSRRSAYFPEDAEEPRLLLERGIDLLDGEAGFRIM
jgi:hypothetical protein